MGLSRHTRKVVRESAEDTFAVARIDLAKPFDAKYLRNVTSISRAKGVAPWKWYDNIGEVHYAVSRGAKIAGYTKLAAYSLNKDGSVGKKLVSGTAADIAAQLSSPYGGMRGLVDRYFTLAKIPGDAYLIRCRDEDSGEVEGYDFISADEIDRSSIEGNGSVDKSVVFSPNQKIRRITLPSSLGGEQLSVPIEARDFIGRVWRPSGRYVDIADSPMKALETNCELLHLLTINLKAKLMSRLALNGIFFVPNEINDIRAGGPVAKDGEVFHENRVLDDLIRAATYAVMNYDDPEAALPIFMAGPGAFGDMIKHIVYDREIYAVDMQLRAELLDRILMGLDVQPQNVRGMGDSNHWCQDSNTEIMALSRGWITHDQLDVGDFVLTINHETGVAEWQPVEDIYRADVVDEQMLSMESESHSSLSTAGHRWPVIKTGKFGGSPYRWTTSRDGFAASDRVPVAARCARPDIETKYTDDFVRLVAAYTSDGYIKPGKAEQNFIRIAKFDPEEIISLRRVLANVAGSSGFSEAAHPTSSIDGTAFNLNMGVSNALFTVTHGKKVIDLSFIDDLTPGQLQLLLDSMIEIGDGIRGETSATFFQVESERLDPLEYAAILVGYKTTRGVRNQQTGFGDTPLSWLRISKSRTVFSPAWCTQEWVPYTGTVWCPVTKNTTWLARRNGKAFFTGNSAWATSDEERRVNIQPDIETMCWALTRLVLWREMEEAGMKPGAIMKTVIWYDLTDANVKTNLAEDARQMLDRAAVSDSAARRMSGIGEADAPTDEEYIRNIGRKMADPYLATYGLPEAENIDWEKVGSKKTGPDPASPADPGEVGPGVGQPGSPGDNKTDTPKRLRPG